MYMYDVAHYRVSSATRNQKSEAPGRQNHVCPQENVGGGLIYLYADVDFSNF